MSHNEDTSIGPSVSLTDVTSHISGSGNVTDLRKQIWTLRAENEGYKRTIPILTDLEGRDVTEKMTELVADLVKSREIAEDWQKRYANQEKTFYNFKKKTHEELTALENKIDRLRERAKTLEIDNEKLRKQLEDDESRIFHLQQHNQRCSEISEENEPLSMEDFNNQLSVSNLQQELAEKEDENVQLANQVAELQKTIDELRTVVTEQSKALETFRDLDEREFNNRRMQIRTTNDELANEYRHTDTQLRRHLNHLSEDSVCSSVALCVQQTANESRALDMSRADILNKTADVTQNLATVVSRMNVLRGVCNELFSKLQGTAEFLQNLLDGLNEDDDDARKLMERIKSIRLDLDKSRGEAMLLVDEVKKAEKSILEFQSILGQTLEQTEADESQDQSEVQQVDSDVIREECRKENDKLKGVEDRNEALLATLHRELKKKEQAESRVAILEKQLREIEEKLNEKTQELQVKLNEHEQREVQLQSNIEGLNFAVTKLGGELDSKSQALVVAQNQNQNMRKRLDEARNTVDSIRTKYDEYMEATKKCSKDVQRKDHAIQRMVQKIERLEEKLQFAESDRNKNVDRLETKLKKERRRMTDFEKESKSLQEKCFLLENEVQQLRTELEDTNAIVEKGNEVLRRKLEEGSDDTDTLSIEEEGGEQVANFDELVNFLADCKKRADNSVQLMKKAEEMASTTNIKLPFCDNVLNELRFLRLMLHKIAKFFDANKENLSLNTKTFADKVKQELVNIHAALKEVASQKLAPVTRNSAKVKETGGQRLEKRKK
ncbi:hypothetical protein Ddc_14339 [Ditylenchus destructor]|nr:hypothetical protein Ddc_14339 [Ditylenchus destructor]